MKTCNYLICIPRLCLGGAEIQAIKLANTLAKDFGYTVSVLLIKDSTPESRKLLHSSIELVSINKSRGILSSVGALIKFLLEIRRRKVKILILYLSQSELYYFLAYLLGMRIPAISMVRSKIVVPKSPINKLKGQLYGSVFSEIIINSMANFGPSAQFYGRLPKYLPNFVDVPSSITCNKRSSATIRLIYVARFIPEKNHLFLINFIQKYKDHNFELLLIGDLNAYFEEFLLAHIENVHNKVKYIKNTPHVRQHISQSDIFVFPSEYTEGCPNVILESMSEGVPVIVTSSQSELDLPCIHYESGNHLSLLKCVQDVIDNYSFWVRRGSDYLARIEQIRKFVICEVFANDRA